MRERKNEACKGRASRLREHGATCPVKLTTLPCREPPAPARPLGGRTRRRLGVGRSPVVAACSPAALPVRLGSGLGSWWAPPPSWLLCCPLLSSSVGAAMPLRWSDVPRRRSSGCLMQSPSPPAGGRPRRPANFHKAAHRHAAAAAAPAGREAGCNGDGCGGGCLGLAVRHYAAQLRLRGALKPLLGLGSVSQGKGSAQSAMPCN